MILPKICVVLTVPLWNRIKAALISGSVWQGMLRPERAAYPAQEHRLPVKTAMVKF